MNPTITQIPFEYLLPVVVVPTLFFAVQHVFALRRNDRFLARLFSEHRDIWDALGGPRGWQWSPPLGERAPANSPSIYFDWFSRAEPSWLLSAPDLRADYLVIRRDIRRFNFVVFPLFIRAAVVFVLLIAITQ